MIGCKGSKTAKTAANPFLPHEMAKGSTWSPAIRTATCNTHCTRVVPGSRRVPTDPGAGRRARQLGRRAEGLLPMTSYTLRLE